MRIPAATGFMREHTVTGSALLTLRLRLHSGTNTLIQSIVYNLMCCCGCPSAVSSAERHECVMLLHTWHAEGFGHAAQANATLIAVCSTGYMSISFVLKKAVHLITEKVGTTSLAAAAKLLPL